MMKPSPTKLIALGLFATGLLTANTALAEGRLTVYCSATNAMCENAVSTFGKKYDVKTAFVRNGSGSTFAKIKAEASNPQADVWYGGTFDPHSQAAEIGLLEPYVSKNIEQIEARFRDPGKKKGNYSSAIYMGILGFGINTDRLKELGIKEAPKCWKDLLKPEFKGEVQVADPQSSGTAYTAIATFVQLWGEDEAFDYFNKLNENISQYTKSGVAPSRNAARGETLVGIGFLHDYMLEKVKGANLQLVVPCEGTGYELGGVSILKGARNLDNAKLFVDWALSKEGQESAWKQGKSLQIVTNTTAEQHPDSPNPNELKLIDYDFEKYGASEERKRLINRWVNDIKLAK